MGDDKILHISTSILWCFSWHPWLEVD